LFQIGTALNGGDIGKALTTSLIGTAGLEVGSIASDIAKGGELGTFLESNPKYLSNLASSVTQTALKGGDLTSALEGSLLAAGVDMTAGKIDGFDQLNPKVQEGVKSAIAKSLQGKDPTSAVLGAAYQAGKDFLAPPAAQDDGTTSDINDLIKDIQTNYE